MLKVGSANGFSIDGTTRFFYLGAILYRFSLHIAAATRDLDKIYSTGLSTQIDRNLLAVHHRFLKLLLPQIVEYFDCSVYERRVGLYR